MDTVGTVRFLLSDQFLVIYGLVGLSAAIYFMPLLIAAIRGHRQTLAIGVLNLFTGWTAIGWIAALVWACTNPAAAVVLQGGVVR